MATSTPTNRSNAIHLLVFLLLLPFAAAGKCNEDDKRALLAIKSAFNNAYHFASWTNTSACCHWYGIECDPGIAKGRVTGLFVITDTNLTGPIPAAVGDLPYLTSLRFHKLPNVVGSIPFSITRLTRLSVLLLSWNSLSGPIPAFLSQVPSLTVIDLNHNKITGSIPAQINQLKVNTLIGFNVSHNQLCGKIPAGPITAKFGPDAFSHNKCLCGSPLPPCRKS